VKSLRQYGWSSKYHSAEYGRNSRMDEMQAAILRAKLPHLDGWNARRRQIAATYNRALAGQPAICPPAGGEDYVAHLYVVRTSAREEVCAVLKNRGIETGIHYPVPDHLQDAAHRTQAGLRLPSTEQAARQVLTLPCYAELESSEVAAVTAALAELVPVARVG
jgi:dTDP-4-amino-4,6-dideoxygalactose transaminase